MPINRRTFVTLLGCAAAYPLVARAQPRPARILYCTHSAGYRHDSIPLSQAIMKQVGETSGMFNVTTTEDVSGFTVENLARYDAVMFFTTGELPMSAAHKAALVDFVRSGHGFVGVHSATDTYYEWPDYLALIGGYFDGHPWGEFDAPMVVEDAEFPGMRHLRSRFTLKDEIYQIKDYSRDKVRVLLRLDPSRIDLSKKGVRRKDQDFAVIWARRYGNGRVLYNGLGHRRDVWDRSDLQKMWVEMVLWSMGLVPGDATPRALPVNERPGTSR